MSFQTPVPVEEIRHGTPRSQVSWPDEPDKHSTPQAKMPPGCSAMITNIYSA